MADDGKAPPDDSNKAKAAAFAERMGQSASGANDDAKADAKDENEGLTKAQIAAKERRAARETARQTRASKRPVKEEDKEPEATAEEKVQRTFATLVEDALKTGTAEAMAVTEADLTEEDYARYYRDAERAFREN